MERLPATITRLQFSEVNLAIRDFTLRTRENVTRTGCLARALLVSLVVTASSQSLAAAREAERIASGIYMLHARTYASDAGEIAGANAAFIVGSRGVVVIDTGISRAEGD